MNNAHLGLHRRASVRHLLKCVHCSDRGERSVYELPSVLLQAVPARLTLAAWLYSVTFTLNMTIPRLGFSRAFNYEDGVAFVFITAGVLFALVSRSQLLQPRQLMYLGLFFMFVGTVGIAYVSIHPPFPYPLEEAGFVGIPWTCVWILFYPLLVPGPPFLNVLVGVLSACAVPATVWLHVQLLDPQPNAAVSGMLVFLLVFPNVLCALLGWLSSSVLHGLAHDVEDARQMGSYHLEELLGRGAMGEVWRARHRMLARPAAVKLIAPGSEPSGTRFETIVRRFEQEAQATASLQSPHSVRVFDFGLAEDGRLYYVMELLDGLDLETLLCQHGPQPSGRVIRWLSQACESLAEAHAHGLVHRDVKPANLYTCRQGLELDVLKVLDFGLVKAISGESVDATRMTAEHVTPGTPATIAPEVVSGGAEVDGRADLYSLGCVGYRLLTGVDVFVRDTAMQTMIAHVKDTPLAMSSRTEVEIPRDLEAIVLGCLSKSPRDRPESALELKRRVDSCADAGSWTVERSARWWEKHFPNSQGERAELAFAESAS